MKFSDALELWIQHENFKDPYATEIRRQFHLHLEPYVNSASVESITNHQLRTAISNRKTRQASLYSISTLCQLQNRFFKFLTDSGITTKNPYSKDLNPKALANKFDRFSNDEELRIREAIPRLPLHNLYRFCYETGVKGQNARAVLREDVQAETRSINILSTISGYPEISKPLETPTTVKVNYDLLEAVLSQSDGQSFLFPGKNGGFVTRTEIISNNHMLKLLTGIPTVSLNHLAMHTNHQRRAYQ